MADWQKYVQVGREQVERVPVLAWLVAAVIVAAFAVVAAMEFSSPPYAALYEGLSSADGGKVIAQLQKLGIPYQLQAGGNIILVPEPQLAEARLQLGAAEVPQNDESAGWDKLENAPMTVSDLAQTTMATRALEASLEQSIGSMAGIKSAQVFLALPADSPFLADQPKPTASVVIAADQADAQDQGPAIAALVAGAVAGLSAPQVNVETTSGVTVYPDNGLGNASSQFQTVAGVENAATARIAQLLVPLVGAGNFRTDVSADVDFTQEHVHQISYGPRQLVSHEVSQQTQQFSAGGGSTAIGVPGALSNEPPAATTATPPAVPTSGGGSDQSADSSGDTGSGGGAAPAAVPHQTSKNLDQTYVTDQSESDITKPGWVVNSIAVSVVLNKAALGTTSIDQVKSAIAGAFAYSKVNVNVLAAAFRNPAAPPILESESVGIAAGPVSRAVLEVLAAAALLFGVALPLGGRLARLGMALPEGPGRPALAQFPAAMSLPKREFADLRDQALENPTSVARLLQSWTEENE